MDEGRQITFMQARIARTAVRRWNAEMHQVMSVFSANEVFGYIRDCFDYFHLEGDEAVLDDVAEYLKARGVDINAAFA